jgi:hypothetical protein
METTFYRGLLFGVSLAVGLVWGPLVIGLYVLVVAR